MNYTVSIIGRSNVGKSTLFNRFIGEKKSVVHQSIGVTRDCVYGHSNWNGINFSLIDTGGFTIADNFIEKKINKNISKIIINSDVILFLMDIQSGLLNLDIELADLIRKFEKKVLLVINKIDKESIYSNADFFHLGFKNYYFISAINGSGTGDLLDKISSILKKKNKFKNDDNIKIEQSKLIPRFSIIGRPNVGKSTLINSFINKNHHLVTEIAGTTRDSLDVIYNDLKYQCVLIDTPGLRRLSKIEKKIELNSIKSTIKTIKSIDICLLMIDVLNGWKKQETKIFNLVIKNYKGIIIIVNKWDLFSNKKNILLIKKYYKRTIEKKIHPLNVPILFVSAKNKYAIKNIIPTAFKILKASNIKLKTNILNKIMLPIIQNNPPPSIKKYNKNKLIRIKYCTQLPSSTPKFIFFSNYPQYIKKSYKRFIENKIRYYFGFQGLPIQIFFRKK